MHCIGMLAPSPNTWACLQERQDSMHPLIGPLLKAMHRVAREHNQQPSAGVLANKTGAAGR